MRVFKTKTFARLARQERILDADLWDAVDETNGGDYSANLGGGVYKRRLARPGKGKSGGFRVIILLRVDIVAYLYDLFAKSDRENLTRIELQLAKKIAKTFFAITSEQQRSLIAAGDLLEILGPTRRDKG